VRVEYHLTEKGRALEAVMDAVGSWAEAWIPQPVAEATCAERESACAAEDEGKATGRPS
jgi:DNA-binding HxlR family transcriptional regulator